MFNIPKLSLIVLLLLSPPALACRDAYQSHAQRLAASELAVVARVSGVLVPTLEQPEIRGRDDAETLAIFANRKIRLAVIRQLKGQLPTEITIEVTQCSGSLAAKIGDKVYAYRIASQWRVISTSNPGA
jgi:hypothetical protein